MIPMGITLGISFPYWKVRHSLDTAYLISVGWVYYIMQVHDFYYFFLDMPKEYIYEPWTAPLSIQTKAKCIIGKDYPKPG